MKKALVGAANQENALEGAFSVIVKSLRIFVWSSTACACDGAVEDNKEVSTQERDINWHIASAAIVPKLH